MSLSASLQRINNDQQGSGDTNNDTNNGGGGGFLRFLTPWKNNKRKHVDTAEETQSNLPRFDNSNINAISNNNNSNTTDHSNNEVPSSRKKARPSLRTPVQQLTERTSRYQYQQPSMSSSSTARRRFSTGTVIRRNRASIGSSRRSHARRPRIDANFRPMSQYLLTNNHAGFDSSIKYERDISLAARILKDAQSKLTHMDLSRSDREEALTFAQERSEAVTRSAPRVRMTRVWGEGQMGGRFTKGPPATSAVAAAAAADVGYSQAAAQRGVNTAENRPTQPTASIFQASVSASKTPKKKAVTFSTAPQQEEYIEVTEVMPSNLVLTPLSKQRLPKSQIDNVVKNISDPRWQDNAMAHSPFGKDALTPTKKSVNKRKGTPFKKEVNSAVTTTPATDNNNGAPFGFMPKDTPSFKTPTPSITETPKLQNKNDTPPTTTTGGWGNLFSQFTPKEGEWKCNLCYVKNKKDDMKCIACIATKDGEGANTAEKSSGGNENGITKVDTAGGSIGSGGFSFGTASATTATATPTTTEKKASIGSAGFSFGTPSATVVAPATTEKKADIGSGGFSFGTTTTTAEKKADIGSGGFSFGATSATKSESESIGNGVTLGSVKDSKLTEKKEDTKPTPNAGGSGFSFGAFGADKLSTGAFASTLSKSTEKNDTTKPFAFGTTTSTTPSNNDAKVASVSLSQYTPSSKSNDCAQTPVPTFGGTPAATNPKATKPDSASFAPAFSFGKTAQTPAPDSGGQPAPSFSFGQAPASSSAVDSNAKQNTPTPAFGQVPLPAAVDENKSNPPAPAFSFGSVPAVDDNKSNPPAPAFSFGSAPAVGDEKSNPTAPPAFSFGQASSKTPAADNNTFNPIAPPAFSFGSTQAVDGNKLNPPASTLSFGGTPAPAANSNTSGFSFGGTPAQAPTQPSAASFSFGSTNTTAEGFGNATPANASNQMAFGTNTNNTSISTGFAPAASAPIAPMAGFTFGPVPTTQTASFGMPPNNNPMSSTTPGGGSLGTALGPAPSFGAGNSSTTPGGFSIGTSDSKKTARRFVRARRPK